MILQPVLIRIPMESGMSGAQRVERQRQFARLALDHSARLCGAAPGSWPQAENRAPQPRDGFYWSIAHKPGFAAAVVAREPVGIDIEALSGRGRDLSEAVAGPEEWAALAPRGDSSSGDRRGHRLEAIPRGLQVEWRNFFVVWTAKEATLKANGCGIGEIAACRLAGLDAKRRLVLAFRGREFIVQHMEYAGHVACVTAGSGPVQWHVIQPPR